MRQIPLEETHIELKAKMVDFAGFNMPISYTSINEEHLCVRNSVGVFDVSHMGEIIVTGNDALQFLQYVTVNDVSKLVTGRAQYSCLPNENGGIVDDIYVYCEGENKYLLVVNASNIEKDFEWLKQCAVDFDVLVENISDQISQLAVQGPKAAEALQSIVSVDILHLKKNSFLRASVAGENNVLISATGYTGSGGFEIYMRNSQVKKIWDALFDLGLPFDIKPIGLAARDTLRLEKGYCLYGNDINDETSPIQAGLSWITKFIDGKNFIGRGVIEKHLKQGVDMQLSAIKIVGKGIPRNGYEVVNEKGDDIGMITSGTMSPVLKIGICLGYLKPEFSDIGASVWIKIRNKLVEAEVVALPFV